MIEKFNGIIYLIVFLVHFIGTGVYSFQLIVGTKKFRERFAGTPVRRLGYERFLRNTLIAIGNSKDKFFIKPVMKKLDHVDILVRGMAVWALYKLSPQDFMQEKQKRLHLEKDHSVKNEWELGRLE